MPAENLLAVLLQTLHRKLDLTSKAGPIPEDFTLRTFCFFFHKRTCSCGCGGAGLREETRFASSGPVPEPRNKVGRWPATSTCRRRPRAGGGHQPPAGLLQDIRKAWGRNRGWRPSARAALALRHGVVSLSGPGARGWLMINRESAAPGPEAGRPPVCAQPGL